MSAQAPLFLDPYKAADREARFGGVLPLAKFSRLLEIAENPAGEVELTLEFRRDPVLAHCVEGTVSTEIEVICQRCLEPFRLPLAARFLLKLVRTEDEAVALDDGVDPVVLDDDEQLDVVRMLEDELLLAAPGIPKHSDKLLCGWDGWREAEELPGRENPFGVLADFKKH